MNGASGKCNRSHLTLSWMLETLAAIIYSMEGADSVILQSQLALARDPPAAGNVMLAPCVLQLSAFTTKPSNFVTKGRLLPFGSDN